MIVDRLRALSPGFRNMTRGAQVIRVPFEVCPFTDQPDGRAGLWWRGWDKERIALIPMATGEKRIDCSWWRPPFEKMIIVSERDEAGVMYVIAQQQGPGLHKHELEHKWGAYILLITRVVVRGREYVAPLRVVHFFEDSDRVAMSGLDEAAAIAYFTQELMSGLDGSFAVSGERLQEIAREAWASVPDKDRNLDVENIGCVFSTACALLCCKNITTEKVYPPERQQQKRQRQGKLPLVSWHVLKVGSGSRSHGHGTGQGDPLALHWVRGHFKHYTADKPLLGRAVGTYWWSPHLAGQADRVVLKDYEVKEGTP